MRAWSLVVLLCLAGAGCGDPAPGDGVEGRLGRLRFHWPGAPAAAFASSGRLVPVRVRTLAREDRTLTLTPTRPDLVAVERGGPEQLLRTGAAGEAELEARDESGALVDVVGVRVADVATLDLGPGERAPVLAVSGAVLVLAATPRAADGTPLVGWHLVEATVDGPLRQLGDGFPDMPARRYTLRLDAEDAAGVTVTAGSVSERVDITGVPVDVVDDVELSVERDEPNERDLLRLRLLSAGRPVYGAPFRLTADGPGTLNAATGSTQTLFDPTWVFTLSASKRGRYTLYCRVGSLERTLSFDL